MPGEEKANSLGSLRPGMSGYGLERDRAKEGEGDYEKGKFDDDMDKNGTL